MHKHEADYTNTFRDLSQEELPDKELYATVESFQAWHTRWQARLGEEDLKSSLGSLEIRQPGNWSPATTRLRKPCKLVRKVTLSPSVIF